MRRETAETVQIYNKKTITEAWGTRTEMEEIGSLFCYISETNADLKKTEAGIKQEKRYELITTDEIKPGQVVKSSNFGDLEVEKVYICGIRRKADLRGLG